MSAGTLGVQKLFSLASRERCMMNLKKFRVYKSENKPSANAAVLIPLCLVNNETSLLYTVRSTNLKSHSGQVAFPGGKTDNDETPIATALRETQEEIGLSPEKIDIWGCGQAVPGKANKYLITPVIGCIRDLKENDLNLNKYEVKEVFTVSLATLCNPENQFHTEFSNGFVLPVFVADIFKIWGVTAYMTHIFLSCLLCKDIYRGDWMKKKMSVADVRT